MKLFLSLITTCVCLGLFISSYSVAFAEKQIEILTISHAKKSNDLEVITFTLSASVEPKMFRLKGDNPRLVLDFMNSVYRGDKSLVLAEGRLATSIRCGIHQQPELKTRVVVDLSKDFSVDYARLPSPNKNQFVVEIKPTVVEEIQAALPVVNKQDDKTSSRQAELNAIPLDKKPVPPVFTGKKKVTSEVVASENVVAAKDQSIEQVKAATTSKISTPEPMIAKSMVVEIAGQRVESSKEHDIVSSIEDLAGTVTKEKRRLGGPELLAVSYDDSSNRGEMVLFHLNDFFPPSVAAVEKENPRVLCDFNDMSLAKDVKDSIFANGKFVERIRITEQKDLHKIRVILDLTPDRDYDLQQVFFKNDNLFVLIVNELPLTGSQQQQ